MKKSKGVLFVTALLVISLIAGFTCTKIEATEEDKESRELRIGAMFSPTDTFDPTTATSPGTMILLFNLYDSLAIMTTDGLQMSLAESITANETADEWTIVLRDNLKFSTGEDVTGQDVLDSLFYMATAPAFQASLGAIDQEKSTAEDKTVKLKLKMPVSNFDMAVLGMMSTIAPGGKFEGVGAGPYVLVSGDSQSGYKLKANPDYWSGKVKIENVSLVPIPDPASQLKALQAGEIDYAMGLEASSLKILENNENVVIKEGTLDSSAVKTIVLNTRVAPFNDPELRKAAKLVVDREKMVNVLLGDYGVVGNDMLGMGYARYPADIPQTEANKDEARKVFEEKGVDSFKIITADVLPGLKASAELAAQEFAEIGVTVEIETMDPESYYDNLATIYGESAFTAYWINRDPLIMFDYQAVKDSPYNASGYSSDLILEQFAKAKSSTDKKVQQEAIDIISKDLHDNGGEIIWGYQKQISAMHKGLEGVEVYQSIPWLVSATFDPEK